MKKTIMKRGLIAGVGAVITGSLLFGLTGALADDPGASPASSTGIAPTFNGVHVEGVIDNPDATVNSGAIVINDTDGVQLNSNTAVTIAGGATGITVGGADPDTIEFSGNVNMYDQLTTDDLIANGHSYIGGAKLHVNSTGQIDNTSGQVKINDTDGVQLGSDTDGLFIKQNGDINSNSGKVVIQDNDGVSIYGTGWSNGLNISPDWITTWNGDTQISIDNTGTIRLGDDSGYVTIAEDGRIGNAEGDVFIDPSIGTQIGSDTNGIYIKKNGDISSKGFQVNIDDNLNITGQSVTNGTTYINGHVDSDGDTVIFDAGIDMGSNDIGLTGNINLEGNIHNSNGYLTVNDYMDVQSGILDTTGDLYIADNLSVYGAISDSNNSTLTINDGLTVNGKITASGGIGTYTTILPSTVYSRTAGAHGSTLVSCPSGSEILSCGLIGYTTDTGGGQYEEIAITGTNISSSTSCYVRHKNTGSVTGYYRVIARCFNPSA